MDPLLTHKPFALTTSNLVWLLGLSFEVSKMLELMKLLSYMVTMTAIQSPSAFFANNCESIVENHPISNAS